MSAEAPDYYATLEVHPSASTEVIAKAYRVLAARWHPDRFPEAERPAAEVRLRAINEAYSILRSAASRAAYDGSIGPPRTHADARRERVSDEPRIADATVCGVHPERARVAMCGVCRASLCEECVASSEGVPLCRECAREGKAAHALSHTPQPGRTDRNHYRRPFVLYGMIALVVVALVFVLPRIGFRRAGDRHGRQMVSLASLVADGRRFMSSYGRDTEARSESPAAMSPTRAPQRPAHGMGPYPAPTMEPTASADAKGLLERAAAMEGTIKRDTGATQKQWPVVLAEITGPDRWREKDVMTYACVFDILLRVADQTGRRDRCHDLEQYAPDEVRKRDAMQRHGNPGETRRVPPASRPNLVGVAANAKLALTGKLNSNADPTDAQWSAAKQALTRELRAWDAVAYCELFDVMYRAAKSAKEVDWAKWLADPANKLDKCRQGRSDLLVSELSKRQAGNTTPAEGQQ